MANGQVHSFYTFEDFGPALKDFFENYRLNKVITPPGQKQPKGKPKNLRICRFCGVENSPESFRGGDSHLISGMLGNRYLMSDFECFNCNQKFSEYERDFADFLGIYRALFKVRGREGKVPRFKSKDKALKAQKVDFYGVEAVTLQETTERIKSFKFDAASGKIFIQFQKDGYIPIHIYKTLFKIALSIVPENEADRYKQAYEFLLSTQKEEMLKGLCQILYFELPFTYRMKLPVCYLFKKINPDKQIPTHIFMLRFQHLVFQFPLYYHIEDINKRVYETKAIEMPWCPPILYHPPTESRCDIKIMNLHSTERVEEDQVISFVVDPQRLTEIVAMDKDTGEMTDTAFNPEEIAKFILYDGNETPEFPKFNSPSTSKSDDENNNNT